MESLSPAYNELNKAWKSTCKILFGEEIGELKEYEDWLKEYLPQLGKRKSCLSGKDVTFAIDDYCKTSKAISSDEVKEKAITPLSINEIKDIDSILRAISENWEYCGNKALGTSSFVEASDGVMDSQYISHSSNVQQSSRIFASAYVTNNKYAFGCLRFSNNEFSIRAMRVANTTRCFESRIILDSSDIYFGCANSGCSDLMFCFNQWNKRNSIGNLQLSREQYTELKKKLLEEVRDELKKNKKFPSLFELVPNKDPTGVQLRVLAKKEVPNIGSVEKAFTSTCRVIFKKELGSIILYEPWLSRHLGLLKEIDSPFGCKTYFLQDRGMQIYSILPEKRVISQAETMALGELGLHLNESDLTSIERIRDRLSEIAYLTDETYQGVNRNIVKTPAAISSSNIYKVHTAVQAENAGVCAAGIINSKYAFGCDRVIQSQFSMNCYNSLNLNRCLELDACTNCADTYFSHNCEGLSDAMFCFNTKAKRFAIGNSQLPPDKYRKIKDMLIEQMSDEIIKKKELRYDIFNIGCGKI